MTPDEIKAARALVANVMGDGSYELQLKELLIAALDKISRLQIVAKHARKCSNGQPYVSEESWDELDAALKNIGVTQWETIPTITDSLEKEIAALRAAARKGGELG